MLIVDSAFNLHQDLGRIVGDGPRREFGIEAVKAGIVGSASGWHSD